MPPAVHPSPLADLVHRYRVCWEVWPEFALVRGVRRQIGFALKLSGTHEVDPEPPRPGCLRCQHIFAVLRRIAEQIQPAGHRASRYEIGPYDQAIRYSSHRGNRPDVTLAIRILHRSDFENPVDDCQVRCLEEMKQHLRKLGACENHWRLEKETP